jgi:ferredoxin
VARAGIIWKRRKQILAAMRTDPVRVFARALKQGLWQRDAEKDALKTAAASRLSAAGFDMVCSPDAAVLAAAIAQKTGGAQVLRSSSRLSNFLTGLLPQANFIQTDIYDRYIAACREAGIDAYPRLLTRQEDYERLPLWEGKSPEFFFTDYLTQIPAAASAMVGTNQLTANGELMICENTGNITRLLTAPQSLLLTADEKLVPTLQDAFHWQSLYSMYGLRTPLAAHTHILTRPAFTDTLPGIVTPFGNTGVTVLWAEEKTIHNETGSCTECGLCMELCPAVELYGNDFSWKGYTGAIGVLKAFVWEGNTGALTANAWMCNGCGHCSNSCPVDFDVFGSIRQLQVGLESDNGYREKHAWGMTLMEEYFFMTRQERTDHLPPAGN